MINCHESAYEVKLREKLVNSHTDGFEGVHSIIILNELVVGPSHPGKAEKISKSWVNEHGEHLSCNFVNCSHVAVTGSLQHLA